MTRPIHSAVGTAILACLLTAGSAMAAVFQVTTTWDLPDDAPGDGVCSTLVPIGPPVGFPPTPPMGFRCTFRGALQEANRIPGADEVLLPAASMAVILDDDDPFALTEDVAIRGAGIATTTLTLSGTRSLDAGPAALELSDVTLLNSGTNQAVVRGWREVTLRRVVASGFSRLAQTSSPLGVLTVEDSMIEDTVDGLRAIGGRLVVDRSRVETVLNASGGVGVAIAGSAVVLRDTTVEGEGVGVSVTVGPPPTISIERSTLRGLAWAIWTSTSVSVSEIWVSNSTLSGNAGGIGVDDAGDVVLEHVTLTGSGYAGLAVGSLGVDSLILDHAIVAGNAIDCFFAFYTEVESRYSLDGDGSCGLTDLTDLPATDPALLPLADNGGPTWTHSLASGSPALDGGDTACSVSVDQRGEPRPRGTACDLGAFEGPAPSGGPACGLGAELVLALPLLTAWRRRTRAP